MSAVPPEQIAIDPAHGRIDGQSEKSDGDHSGNDLIRPQEFPRLENAVAESIVHGDHFRDDNNNKRDSNPYAQTRKDIRGSCREDDSAK